MFKGLTARRLYKSFGVKGLMLTYRLLLDLPSEYFPTGNGTYFSLQTIDYKNTFIILAANK
jgi:hypothetical protein